MSRDELERSAISRAGVVRVRTALNPYLWLCAVLTPTFLAGGWAFGDDHILRYILVALSALPSFLAMGAATYLLLNDRDRLQSEEFVLRQLELKITERKGLPPSTSDIDVADEEPEAAKLPGEGQ